MIKTFVLKNPPECNPLELIYDDRKKSVRIVCMCGCANKAHMEPSELFEAAAKLKEWLA